MTTHKLTDHQENAYMGFCMKIQEMETFNGHEYTLFYSESDNLYNSVWVIFLNDDEENEETFGETVYGIFQIKFNNYNLGFINTIGFQLLDPGTDVEEMMKLFGCVRVK